MNFSHLLPKSIIPPTEAKTDFKEPIPESSSNYDSDKDRVELIYQLWHTEFKKFETKYPSPSPLAWWNHDDEGKLVLRSM